MVKKHTPADKPATEQFVEAKIDELAQSTAKGFIDLHNQVSALDQRMDRFEERMDKFENRMDRFEERMDRFENTLRDVLDIVKSIDAKLAPLVDHPERLAKLEDEVFKLKMNRH